jgi:hypothetical protein
MSNRTRPPIARVLCAVIGCASLSIPLMVSTGALAAPQRPGAEPRRQAPVLVLIHGRDQIVGTRSQVEQAWNRAIDQGLRAARSPAPVTRERRRFYWYADTLAMSAGCRFALGVGDAYVAAGAEAIPTLRNLLASLAERVPADVQRAAISHLMKDTSTYLGNGRVACAVDEGLKDMWASIPATTPIVVVAHSMGSMVLYKNLMNKLQDSHSVYLLTIGSMLGNATVQKTLLGSLADYPAPVPLPVVWWRNFTNDGDHLAFLTADSFASETAAKRPIDVALKVGTADPHAATVYLASSTFGIVLGEIWCELVTGDKTCQG